MIVHSIRSADPSQTAGIRKQFESEAFRRFRWLKGQINDSIVKGDGFGLIDKSPSLMLNRGQFEFERSSAKIDSFMSWLRDQQALGVLGVTQGATLQSAAANAWTSTYISSAYVRGISRAASQMRKGGAQVENSWISSAFQREIHADRIALAYTRTFSELEGITQAMDQQISRVIAQGLAEGRGPYDIARSINDRVDKIGITRARMLARTEVIATHSDAMLNGFQEAEIEGVDVEAEWLTANDPCPLCEDLAAGAPYTIDQARGMIPAHPNCRCSWSPRVVNGTGIRLV